MRIIRENTHHNKNCYGRCYCFRCCKDKAMLFIKNLKQERVSSAGCSCENHEWIKFNSCFLVFCVPEKNNSHIPSVKRLVCLPVCLFIRAIFLPLETFLLIKKLILCSERKFNKIVEEDGAMRYGNVDWRQKMSLMLFSRKNALTM